MFTNKQCNIIDAAINKAIQENYIGNEYDKLLNYCEMTVINAIDKKGIANIDYLFRYVFKITENCVDYYFKWIEI